jgi:hypothetical protein
MSFKISLQQSVRNTIRFVRSLRSKKRRRKRDYDLETTTVCLCVTLYQRLHRLWDIHEIRYESLQKVVDFRENWLSANNTLLKDVN